MWSASPPLSSPSVAARRSGPSGRLPCSPTSPAETAASSRLPPPRSAATPCASGRPLITPQAANRASWSPSSCATERPKIASTRLRNSAPSAASRVAAVATSIVSSTPMVRTIAANRGRLARAWVTPSGWSRPVAAKSRPIPHVTRSLNTTGAARERSRKTTSRIEFDPISTTAAGPPTKGERLGIVVAELVGVEEA
jgi:hypothetical protein